MLLTGFDGSEVEITLSGHRRASYVRGELNWLKVAIRVLAPFGSASYRVPCLLDVEAENLGKWLLAIAQQEQTLPTMDFLSGDVWFVVLERSQKFVILRVCFEPRWSHWILTQDIKTEEDDLNEDFPCVDLEMSCSQLLVAATEFIEAFQLLPLLAV